MNEKNICTISLLQNVQFVNSRTVLKFSFKSFLLEYRTMVISPAFLSLIKLNKAVTKACLSQRVK